jgi:hypothetical protein
MNGVDPMATKYASLSPYNYSFNDPVTFSDVSGADPLDYWIKVRGWVERNNYNQQGFRGSDRYRLGIQGDDDLMYGSSFPRYGPGGINSLGGPVYDPVTRRYYTQDFKNGEYGIYIKRAFIDYSTEDIENGLMASIMIYSQWFAGSINHNRNNGGCPTCPNPPAPVSTTDLLLAGIGTAGLVAESQSAIIQGSRSGFTSGKLSPNSPRVYSKATAGKINIAAKGVGWGLTIWSVANTEIQFDNGQINANRRVYNHINNGVGLVYPVVGLPMAAGDYLGQKYSTEIVNDVSQPGGFLFEGTKFVLEFLGIPTSPRK